MSLRPLSDPNRAPNALAGTPASSAVDITTGLPPTSNREFSRSAGCGIAAAAISGTAMRVASWSSRSH